MIRGKPVDRALNDRCSAKALRLMCANAFSLPINENNHNLDVDELVVAEAYVGKNLTQRGRPRARGRFGRI